VLADNVVNARENEADVRRMASALYNATSAIIMAWEAARSGNWRRLALAHLVLRHKLATQDPLAPSTDDGALVERLINDHEVDQAVAMSILA
jgi:acyl-CoA dehydrogenase